ncbi:MAG: UDP-N-acetylmuramoyl-tripeptide--D-alanyl-D-alanine ligase, partial [Oscillospiraceae bacterium]|nr:UDP-N-acetylmuramoyl-tripeptide--D-alanyl-D-alanine ligase [Oscillospiraceae bacterium]
MNGFCIADITAACSGKLTGNTDPKTPVGELVIDSRLIRQGDVFVAFRGERVDGHDYIARALQNGASCCLAEYVPAGVEGAVILVDDVQTAMEQIAGAYRAGFSVPLVGITGSVGKTTAKEMIAAVLSQRWHLLKTEGNLNNQIGIPMMLSRLKPEHQAAVIEMGISGFGEMSELADFVKPTMAVITKIGHAHLEFLHDLDGVLKAKTEMLDYLPDAAPVIVNGDDEKLHAFSCRQPKILYGLSEDCDVRAEEVRTEWNGMTCDIVCGDRRIPVRIPGYGRHIIYGALAGAAVGLQLGLSDEEIAEGVAAFENVGRRAEVTETGFVTLIDDSYNANPDSVKCGIDSLSQLPGRHVCLLGDMLELGEDS